MPKYTTSDMPRNWRKWSFHLYEITSCREEGEIVYEGHAVSPSGRWARDVTVRAGIVPDVEMGYLEDSAAYCLGCEGVTDLRTAIAAVTRKG